jgi:hypothetical protein
MLNDLLAKLTPVIEEAGREAMQTVQTQGDGDRFGDD